VTEGHETISFRKLEAILAARNLEFPPTMQYQYWHDPAFRAIFSLIVELLEKTDARNSWSDYDNAS